MIPPASDKIEDHTEALASTEVVVVVEDFVVVVAPVVVAFVVVVVVGLWAGVEVVAVVDRCAGVELLAVALELRCMGVVLVVVVDGAARRLTLAATVTVTVVAG